MKKLLKSLALIGLLPLATSAGAAVVTFDDVVTGATSYSYDGDGDAVADVVFSTSDPFGFNTFGPGPNMSYINEPGIEGTTSLAPDLRVDFLNGAIGSLGFGFAMNASQGGAPTQMTFSVFNGLNMLLASTLVEADFTPIGLGTSSFPEAQVLLAFAGTAAYATFDFDPTNADRYIIDNFSGTFGSTEQIPEPATLALVGLALVGMGLQRRRRTGL